MDHSVQAYLERLSNAQLQSLLQYFSSEEQLKHYGYIIPDIARILAERKKSDA